VRRPRRRDALRAAGAALLVSALVGCGSTSDSSKSTTSSSLATAASSTTDPQPLTAELVTACKATLDVDKKFKTGTVVSDEDLRAATKGLTDAMRAAGRTDAAGAVDKMLTSSPTGGLDGFKAAVQWCDARQ